MKIAILTLLAPSLGLLSLSFFLPYPRASFPAYLPPGPGHPLGTDDAGYDVLSLLAHGARTTLGVGFLAGSLATFLGAGIGGSAGLWSRLEAPLMRLTDLFFAFPRLPLLILMSLYLRPDPLNAVLVLALFGWPDTARTLRPLVAGLRQAGYVRVARSLGAGGVYLLTQHVLPQAWPLVATQWILEVRFALIAGAGLAFLGLTDPTQPDWGVMLFQAFNRTETFLGPYWIWTVLPPALALASLVLGLSLAVLGRPRQLDPRLGG